MESQAAVACWACASHPTLANSEYVCKTDKQARRHETDQAKHSREVAAWKAHREAGCPDDGIICEDCCEHPIESRECTTCNECGEFVA